MSDYEKKYKEALDKAKRYDEVFNAAKEWYNNPNSSNIGKSYLYAVFPELKWSEDDKIRKEILDCFRAMKQQGCFPSKHKEQYDSWIAWLEKQDESNLIKEIKRKKDLLLNEKRKAISSKEKLSLGGRIAMLEELLVWLKYDITGIKSKHADGKLGEMIKRKLEIDKQSDKPQGKSAFEAINEEKVDNQFCVKPVDKVESKFKIGDWVFSSVLGTARIIGVNDSNEYQLEYIDGKQEFSSIDYVNYAYDKWTLQDVKNGDVLYSPEHKLLWIYKNKEEYHASINLNCANFVSICAYIVIPSDVCPATKEQRDVLEKTMTKVGYKWDADKKKLEIIDWSKHIKYEPNCPSITEKKSTWSEEDEERIKNILSVLDAQVCWDGATGKKGDPYQKEIDWLKSLKDRYIWKPSDEQINQLGWIAKQNKDNMIGKELIDLYNNLKKLKGE